MELRRQGESGNVKANRQEEKRNPNQKHSIELDVGTTLYKVSKKSL